MYSKLLNLSSLLGLFGISSFMAEHRAKELGIRKVLGPSTISLWNMLCRQLVLLLRIAIAIPAGYWAVDNVALIAFLRMEILPK
jgi:putative ABC transport system permease protein